MRLLGSTWPALWAVALLAWQSSASADTPPQSNLRLEDLVREVKVALLRVQEAPDASQLPALEKAVLEVNTEVKTEEGGKISLWVVELGGTEKGGAMSSIELTLKPPEPGSPTDVANEDLADALAAAILAGARAVFVASQGNPPLVPDHLTASIKFAVEADGNGGLAVKFPPFEVGANASFSSAQVQTIAVTYQWK